MAAKLLFMIGLLSIASVQAELYKCKDSAGDNVFTDKPCGEKTTIIKHYATRPAIAANPVSPMKAVAPIEATPQFANMPLDKAVAVLESVRNDGRLCEEAIRGGKKRATVCGKFIGRMAEGGDWLPARGVVDNANKNKDFVQQNAEKMLRVQRLMDDAQHSSQMVRQNFSRR